MRVAYKQNILKTTVKHCNETKHAYLHKVDHCPAAVMKSN